MPSVPGLAAIAAVLLCANYPDHHAHPGLNAWHQGLHRGGSSAESDPFGALLGGLLLGIIEILSKAYISTQLSDVMAFGVLIVVLS